jgi:hypothetical protein
MIVLMKEKVLIFTIKKTIIFAEERDSLSFYEQVDDACAEESLYEHAIFYQRKQLLKDDKRGQVTWRLDSIASLSRSSCVQNKKLKRIWMSL